MHWRKKCNILSHTAHLKHHSLLKWKFVVIHAASMGEAEPWESSTVNTSLNGPTSWCLLVILWEIHKSNKPKQNTYMHLQLSSKFAFTSAMQTSGYFHPTFISEFRHVKATTVLEAILNGGEETEERVPSLEEEKGGMFHWYGRREEGRDSCKNECRIKTSMPHWWHEQRLLRTQGATRMKRRDMGGEGQHHP